MKPNPVKRSAVLFAAMIEVTCPHCGEPAPAPGNGSDLWTTVQIKAADGTTRTCNSCEEPFVIRTRVA